MNQIAHPVGLEVAREIVSLEKRVDLLKQRIAESRALAGEKASITEAEVRAVITARRNRETMIGTDLFADPAWDILLELYAASLAQQTVSITQITVASAIPATTALRWIAKLESLGLLRREDDHLDGRRVWIGMSAEGEMKMRSFFETIRSGLSLV